MFKDFFELEKKTDGIYRCRGGHLADILLLGGGIILLLVLAFLSPFVALYNKILGRD